MVTLNDDPTSQAPLENHDVLVVEDEMELCDLYKVYLSNMNIFSKIVFAHDGIDACNKLQNQQFQLVILDVNLPKMNGLKVLQNIISSKMQKDIKVLVISGSMTSEVVKETLSSGIKNLLVKPFEEKEFNEKIQKVLNLKT